MSTVTTMTLHDLAPPVDKPWFDLASEPWVDVVAAANHERDTVSLRDLLTRAHLHRLDDSRVGALGVHGLHRLLIAFTYLLHAHRPDHDWQRVATGRAGLPTDAITWLLARFADRLWLQHPTTPFLQRPCVLALMPLSAANTRKATNDRWGALVASTHPYWTLLPHVPAKTNPSWFNRDFELPTPTPADAANALVMRHYFALPGNEAPNTRAGTKTSKGGATGMTPWGRSYLLLEGATLTQTLARNLLSDWLGRITPGTPTFWEAPDAVSENLSNPLWTYAASGAATVLIRVPTDVDRTGFRVVRTPAPISKDAAKVLKEAMVANDPHTLRIPPSSPSRSDRTYVTFSPDAHPLAHVRHFHAKVTDRASLHRPCLLSPHATRYGVRGAALAGLHLSGGGNASNPTVTGMSTTHDSTDRYLLEPDRATAFVTLADRIVGRSRSAASRTAYHIRTAIRADRSQLTWITSTVRTDLYVATERIIDELLTRCAEPDRTPPDTVPDDLWQEVRQASMTVYDDIARRFEALPAVRARILEQRNELWRKLWQTS